MSFVRYKQHEIPPMTPERAAELKAFAERPDSEIDYSEMPEWDEIDFAVAVPTAVARAARRAGPEAVKALIAEIAAHRARLEAEWDAKAAHARIDTEKPVVVHS